MQVPLRAQVAEDVVRAAGGVRRSRGREGAGEIPDPGGVACLDRDDAGRLRDGVAREARALADVGGGGRLLEVDRGAAEVRRARRRLAEVERRRRSRAGAEPASQQRDVVVLLWGDDLREVQQLAAQRPGPQGRVVEGGLRLLEHEQEAQDAHVLGPRRGRCARVRSGPVA